MDVYCGELGPSWVLEDSDEHLKISRVHTWSLLLLPPPLLLLVLPLLGPLPFYRLPRSDSPSLDLAPAVVPMPVALGYPQHLLSGKVSRAFGEGKGWRKEAQFPFVQEGH